MWDVQIQHDKLVMANQPDIIVVDKEKKGASRASSGGRNRGILRKTRHTKD